MSAKHAYSHISDKKLRKKLKDILGFRPKKINLYRQALVHKSAAVKLYKDPFYSNERLEFLGDAILDSIIAEHIFHAFPKQNEGFLTQLRSKIVNRDTLKIISIRLGVGNLVVAKTVNDKHKYLYGDALEALIGAIYLDRGYKITTKFVLNQIVKHHVNLKELSTREVDFKSRIIEWGQKNKKEINFTCQQHDSNEENEPLFVSHLLILDKIAGMGRGTSKKEAEQNAARQALQFLGIE